MKRRVFAFALCLLALLAMTACAKQPSGDLRVEDIREMHYRRLPPADETQTAAPGQIRGFVEAYNEAKTVPGDFGTTAPVVVSVILKSGEEIRVDGGGQSYSTLLSTDPARILEGRALHDFLKGLAAEPPEYEDPASTGWTAGAFKHWAATQYRFESAAKARGSLTFALKTPDPSLVPSPMVVYVGRGEKSKRMATVVFGDPADRLSLQAIRSKTRPHFAADVQRSIEGKASGVYKADSVWQLVTVGGLEGIGIEPGTNDGSARSRLRPGVVSWFDHGVHYVLYGKVGPQGTPLNELLAIAASMYRPPVGP